jgi:hypothetical protein
MLVASEWSSLEITKLVVSALTPILLFALGYVVTKASRRVEEAQREAARRFEEAQRDAARRFEEAQWASRKLIESRLELFEEMAPKLNDLFCCFILVGHFREVTPPTALSRKRELDRIFHSHAPLFSPEFRDRYQDFLNVCFLAFTGAAKPARLRASLAAQKRERPTWESEWDEMFAEGDESTPDQIADAYDDMMDAFAADVGAPRAGRRPRWWVGEPWEEGSRDTW